MKIAIATCAFVLFVWVDLNPLNAGSVRVDAISVANVWSRATSPSMRMGVVYLELDNHGAEPDELISAISDASERAELHAYLMDGDVMRMRPVTAIEVAPGTPTVLQPGSHHIMLVNLRRPLKKGDSFPVTLRFKHAGEVRVDVTVQSAGARSPNHRNQEKDKGGHQHGAGMKMTN